MSEFSETRKNPPASKKVPVGQRTDTRFCLNSNRVDLTRNTLFGLPQKKHRAALVNLSIKGLQLLTSARLKPKDTFTISFFVPDINVYLNMKAVVVWSEYFRHERGKNYYRSGLKYTKIKPETERHLKNLNPHL